MEESALSERGGPQDGNGEELPGSPVARLVLRWLVIIASVVAVVLLVRAAGLDHLLDRAWIDSEVLGHGVRGYLVFLVATAVVTGAGLPRQVPSLLAGYAFGVVAGTALALLGTLLGAAAAFYFARLVGRGALPRRLARRVAKIDAFLADGPFQMALVIRFLPVGSNLVTNLLAGVTRVPGPAFLAGSAVGFLPQTAIFALMGKGFRVDPAWRIGLAVTLLVLSAWLSGRLLRRYRARYRSAAGGMADAAPLSRTPDGAADAGAARSPRSS